MAATTAEENKVDEVVGDNSNVDEVVAEKSSNVDEVAAEKSSNVGEVVAEKSSNVDEVAAEKSKMIELVSSDGERFEITREAAAMSQTIHHMIEDDCIENGVPLPNVNSKILAMVIEYCNKHVAGTSDGEKEDLKSFDENFIKVDQATLFDIILAANYLDIKELLDLSTQTVADMIKGKSVEDIRKTFNITNDFTPEEEQEIRRENPWAFE